MYKFSYQDNYIDIDIDGCFAPNLTTKIMLGSSIKELSLEQARSKRLLELGCGSGVISSYLLKHGFFDTVESVGMSDISPQAMAKAEWNVEAHLLGKNAPAFEFRIGSGLQIWTDFEFDIIINDISAISEAIVPMNDWFSNAPNSAGIDGLVNSIQVLEEFASISSQDAVMLIPVLSLSNVKKLKRQIDKLGLKFERLTKQSWPLPSKMVSENLDELKKLRASGHIDFAEKFGQIVVETACYKIRKV